MIATRDLTFSYEGASHLIKFPDINCDASDKLLILGDSGSGKTTLLHLLSGMLKAKSGTISIAGRNLKEMSDRELDQFRGEEIGMVFQQAHFVQSLTVAENLRLPAFLTGGKVDDELNDRIYALLKRLGVGHKADSLPSNLSVGEQQRASIARAIVHRPSIVFADEPTSALDDKSTDSVISLLEEETAKAGASLIVVTHDSRLKDRYVDRVELNSITK